MDPTVELSESEIISCHQEESGRVLLPPFITIIVLLMHQYIENTRALFRRRELQCLVQVSLHRSSKCMYYSLYKKNEYRFLKIIIDETAYT